MTTSDELRAQLEVQTRRGELLGELFGSVAAATDESDVLESAARSAAEWIGDLCTIVILSDDGEWLDLAAAQASDSDVVDLVRTISDGVRLRAHDGIAGRVLASGEPYVGSLVVPEEAGRAEYGPFVARYPLSSVIAVPLRVRGESIGVLTLARIGDTVPYTAEDLELMRGIAVRTALAYDNLRAHRIAVAEATHARLLAEFFATATQAGDERQVLEELATRSAQAVRSACVIYQATPDGSEFDVVALANYRPKHVEHLRNMFARQRWRSNEGMAGRAFTTGETVVRRTLTADERAAYIAGLPEDRRQAMAELDMRAAIAVPLAAGGRRLGVLTLSRFGPGAEAFDDADRLFAEAIAGRADLALSRLLLLAAQEREARQTRVLADFLAGVAEANGDENEILTRLADAAAAEMGDWCAIKLIAPDDTRFELRAVAAGDPSLVAETRTLYAAHGLPIDMTIDREVIASGRPALIQLDPAELMNRTHPGYRAIFSRGFRSALIVPLLLRDRVAGDISLFRYATSAPYDEDDLRFVEDLARRASLALARHRAERAQRETLARLDAVLSNSPIATVLLDRTFSVVLWNRAAESLFGWTEDELRGRQLPLVPAEMLPDAARLRLEVFAGRTMSDLHTTRLRKDGSEVEVALFAAPFSGVDGAVIGVVLSFVDLTERKRLEAELFEARKLESVGRLAGGVAHDFNNILTAIIGHAAVALAGGPSTEVAESLETIRVAAQRAAGLTAQLLAFSRRQMLQPQVLAANEVVLGTEPILRPLIGEHIELVYALQPGSGAIAADPTQLAQVIINLALNARDAMPAGGRLIIGVERADGHVVISVSDTGTGMDDATKAHIFEPFFTTKEVGKGTGLGLATTYGIVAQSGGRIEVDSAPGAGATFRVYLPAVADDASRPPTEPVVAGLRTGRVLVVEDEPVLRELARRILTRAGFSVDVAATPSGAIEQFDESPEPIDLLITDLVMPGMSGEALVRELRARRPSLPALLMSGYAEDLGSERESGTSFLGKPFGPDDLLAAVDRLLDHRVTAPVESAGRPVKGRRDRSLPR